MATMVKCPHCKKEIEYSTQNPCRPFCSERCQMIDFGKWSEEEFRLPDTENSHSLIGEDSESESESDSGSHYQ